MLFLVLTLFMIFVLLYIEYSSHDCARGKQCSHNIIDNDNVGDSDIDKIVEMVKKNTVYTIWRQSVIVGLISSLLVPYYTHQSLPSFHEWTGILLLVSLSTYLSSSWIWSHFSSPNSKEIIKRLESLSQIVG